MLVIKRDGSNTEFIKDEVLKDVEQFLTKNIDSDSLLEELEKGIVDKITTRQISELLANICASRISKHPDYNKLAASICVVKLHKETSNSYSETVERLYRNDPKLVSDELYSVAMKNKDILNSSIDYNRDFLFDFFGLKTLERSYLKKIHSKTLETSVYESNLKQERKDSLGHNNEEMKFVHISTIIERPQHLWMTVSLGIHGDSLEKVIESYNYMSKLYFTMATPTLFNSGTPRQQMSSCFIFQPYDDIDSIFKVIGDCGKISKYAGGIGLNLTNIRSKGSIIRGTNGKSDGIIPLCKVLNDVARYINQCFTSETIVYSKDGPKRMDQITTGDYLVTMDGSYKKVNSISKNSVNKDILEFRTKFSFEPIRVTNEHDIYIISGQKRILNFNVIKNRLEKNIVKPEFKNAKYVNRDDFVGYPIPKQIIDQDFGKDFCRLYGIMVGDGSIYKRKDCEGVEFKVCLNKTSKTNTVNFVKEYLEKRNVHYWITESKDSDLKTITWSNKSIGIKYEDLYQNGEKYIHSKFMNLPEDKTIALIQGLIETDGSVDKEIYFDSTSYQVAMSMRYLLLRSRILSSGNIRDYRGQGHTITRSSGKTSYIEHKKVCYTLRIPKSPKFSSFLGPDYIPSEKVNFFEYDSMLWSRINEIKQVPYEGDVYDFNMMDNHNYTVASLGLVHNSGLRNGSIATYLQTFHYDILDFIELRKPTGDESMRARDLFLALYVNDFFMKRVEEDGIWSLMCPDECPGLVEAYGEAFEALYIKYEESGKFKKQMKAKDLWLKILEAQIETGMPYMVYKDHVNRKSNQKNVGVVNSSNLCSEICEVYDKENYAVCNLASICLPKFVKYSEAGEPFYDYEELIKIAKIATNNLNKVIDVNFYPTPETKNSNMKLRPIGLGVQGLGDVFNMFKVPYGSEKAKELNKNIFEAIYYGALTESNELAKKDGPYSRFEGSPFSKGQFQYHMCGLTETDLTCPGIGQEKWIELKESVMKYGTRNSLLTTCMPTASTSQIMGNTESFEPRTSNMYVRKTLSGEFVVMNEYLVKDLEKLGLWTDEIRDEILYDQGSIQNIVEIPATLKQVYLTAFEMKQRDIIQQSIDRSRFIDQSQSLNLFMNSPDFVKLNSALFFGWKGGLKTGMYYLRSNPASSAQSFGLSAEHIAKIKAKREVSGESYEVCVRKWDAKNRVYEICGSCQ